MKKTTTLLAALAVTFAATAATVRTATETFVTNRIAAAVAAIPSPDYSTNNTELVETIETVAPQPGDYANVSNLAVHAVQEEADPVWTAERAGYVTTGEVAQVARDLADHASATNNPHHITAAQIGALPSDGGTVNHLTVERADDAKRTIYLAKIGLNCPLTAARGKLGILYAVDGQTGDGEFIIWVDDSGNMYLIGPNGYVKVPLSSANATLARTSDIPAPYTLPAATAQTLGGVKVGSGLSVANDGTLSATGGAANLDYCLRVNPETGGIYYTTPDGAENDVSEGD